MLYQTNNGTLLPVFQLLCLVLSWKVCVFVCVSKTHPLCQRCKDRGQIDKDRSARCETEIAAGRSAECQSCYWSWPPHMALCPGYASRCVTSESAVCVCLRDRHPLAHFMNRGTFVITLPSSSSSYGYNFIIPLFYPPVFCCHFHHCDGHGVASVTLIWYDRM